MFADVAQIPIKNLPTEVLVSLRESITKELNKRGQRGEFETQRPRLRGYLRAAAASLAEESESGKSVRHRLKDLDALIGEDWSHLFPVGDAERRYYVYAHLNPRKDFVIHKGAFDLYLRGTPFYIGKGTGRRAWDLSRNEGHGVELRQLRERGISESEIVTIVRDNLSEREALELESKLIFFFGTVFEAGRRGLLVNLDFPARPMSARLTGGGRLLRAA